MGTSDGRTIQLFLVDGAPTGLIIASIHGWTGSVLVSTQSTFGQLLARMEVNRTGVYILYGPDPEDGLGLRMRAYIGEADSVRERIDQSAGERGFWETAIVVTTSDEALTKGDVRYLEARLIEMTKNANRVTLDNSQNPSPERRRLPEADRANMEAFLANLKVVLPVVGLDLLKPQAHPPGDEKIISAFVCDSKNSPPITEPRFEIRHKSGVKAFAVEEEGEFVVLQASQALKDQGFARSSYERLKQELIDNEILQPTSDSKFYVFSKPYSFQSPSAAAAVILDRNTNGRIDWHLVGSKFTYHEWQQGKNKTTNPPK